jgi:pyruvate/2-oxoglutarate/acetoin dehydrogenase E1 component
MDNIMKYKEALRRSMISLSKDDDCRFIGYGVKYGAKGNGSLVGVNDCQLIETTVSENLIVGMAIGMSIEGLKPVVYIPRFDFIINALDSIVNHLDKIDKLSKGEFTPKVIIRTVIGGTKTPLYTGLTHVQDFTEAVSKMVSFPVIKMSSVNEVVKYFNIASKWQTSMILIEEKDRYEEE